LGFGGEQRPDAAASRSQFEKRRKQLNEACAAAVEQKMLPQLERTIQDVLGPIPAGGTSCEGQAPRYPNLKGLENFSEILRPRLALS
jgi:hypothetical protein